MSGKDVVDLTVDSTEESGGFYDPRLGGAASSFKGSREMDAMTMAKKREKAAEKVPSAYTAAGYLLFAHLFKYYAFFHTPFFATVICNTAM
jgi:hypothetical protein